jgi:hypothetical protein
MKGTMNNIDSVKRVRNKIQNKVMEHANMIGIGLDDESGQFCIKIGFETEQDQETSPYKDGSFVDGVLIKTEVVGTFRAF